MASKEEKDDTGKENAVVEVSHRFENLSLDLKPQMTPDDQLHDLKVPKILPGKDIYLLWKFLLCRWLSKPECKVYLASPFIDVKRMTDICNIVIHNQKAANIIAFYVRTDDNPADIMKEVKTKFKGNEEIIQKKVIEKLWIANTKSRQYFHAKFIGCIDERSDAWVFLTSANFKYNHFDYENPDWVVYQKMSKSEFEERVIGPIELVFRRLSNQ